MLLETTQAARLKLSLRELKSWIDARSKRVVMVHVIRPLGTAYRPFYYTQAVTFALSFLIL